jgi:hypothetical protein
MIRVAVEEGTRTALAFQRKARLNVAARAADATREERSSGACC